MPYVLLVYDHADSLAGLSEHERAVIYGEYEAFSRIEQVAGYRLQPPEKATTLRIDGSRDELNPGPFNDDRLPLAGFYLLQTDDRNHATELARRIPAARLGGAVEIRPLAGEPPEPVPRAH